MRKIEKREEPEALRTWRAAHQADPSGAGINYGYDALRQNNQATGEVLRSLVEQGAICAYTGVRITPETSHIEHLKPQAHCERGEDVAYTNLVACWPQPNSGFQAAFGAHAKGSWPSAAEQHLFVSPLSEGCEARFKFDRHGEIRVASERDDPAQETIARLNLDERRERAKGLPRRLTGWRREAIAGTLGKHQHLSVKDARQRLRVMAERERELNGGANVILAPFCFAIRQALVGHLRRIEAIRALAR